MTFKLTPRQTSQLLRDIDAEIAKVDKGRSERGLVLLYSFLPTLLRKERKEEDIGVITEIACGWLDPGSLYELARRARAAQPPQQLLTEMAGLLPEVLLLPEPSPTRGTHGVRVGVFTKERIFGYAMLINIGGGGELLEGDEQVLENRTAFVPEVA